MSESRKNPFVTSPPSAWEQLAAALRKLGRAPDFRLGLGYFLAAGAGLLFLAVLASLLYVRQIEFATREYGNTIAQQLAQSSVDAVVRSDLVSLHAQLEKLTETDSIVEVAVYDMENHVLAQAGMLSDSQTMIPEDAIRRFPAIITFQDSMAGKVIVSLNTQKILKQKRLLYGYLMCSLLIALGLTILISKFWIKKAYALHKELIDQLNKTISATSTLPALETESNWKSVGKTLGHLEEHIRYLEQRSPAPKFSQTRKHVYQPTEGSYAELMIACRNLDQLQQQLHHRELQRLLDNFQQQLQKASKLYHGVNVDSHGDHVLLRFMVNDVTDASLQAICCAVLLKGLLRTYTPESTTSITLEFTFAVHWHAHDDRPVADLLRNHLLHTEYVEMLQLCQQAKPGEILTNKGIKQSPAVAEHVKLDLISGESDADYYRVLRISDGYKKLLEQQVQQLDTSDPV